MNNRIAILFTHKCIIIIIRAYHSSIPSRSIKNDAITLRQICELTRLIQRKSLFKNKNKYRFADYVRRVTLATCEIATHTHRAPMSYVD